MDAFDFELDLDSAPAGLTSEAAAGFRDVILRYYSEHGRTFPWRGTSDPYAILVSELMLQQTQTERVVEKYRLFIERFPDFPTLARAGLAEVFTLWKGLGYNRRAKALRDLAVRVVEEHEGKLPAEPELLEDLPGIGPYTARAVCAFAFNMPVVFIETNIRRVYIHAFYPKREAVHDRDIRPLVELTLDRRNPRRWYSALMDFGSALKGRVPNPNTRSAHYVRQSPFENSLRQIRGRILGILNDRGALSRRGIESSLGTDSERVRGSLAALEREGLVVCEKGTYRIAE